MMNGCPFLGFTLHFMLKKKLSEQAPTKTWLQILSIMQLRAWAQRQSTYAQLSPLYFLSTLYITHVDLSFFVMACHNDRQTLNNYVIIIMYGS